MEAGHGQIVVAVMHQFPDVLVYFVVAHDGFSIVWRQGERKFWTCFTQGSKLISDDKYTSLLIANFLLVKQKRSIIWQ